MQEIQTIDEFYAESQELLSSFDTFIETQSLTSQVQVDHFCYKCGSREYFESLRALLEPESYFLYQSIVSQRRIALIQLKKGINTKAGLLTLLELSDQKPDGSQVNAFDHLEIYAKGISYEEMKHRIERSGTPIIEVKRPHHITHDIALENGYTVKLTRIPLIDKIKNEEMR